MRHSALRAGGTELIYELDDLLGPPARLRRRFAKPRREIGIRGYAFQDVRDADQRTATLGGLAQFTPVEVIGIERARRRIYDQIECDQIVEAPRRRLGRDRLPEGQRTAAGRSGRRLEHLRQARAVAP